MEHIENRAIRSSEKGETKKKGGQFSPLTCEDTVACSRSGSLFATGCDTRPFVDGVSSPHVEPCRTRDWLWRRQRKKKGPAARNSGRELGGDGESVKGSQTTRYC